MKERTSGYGYGSAGSSTGSYGSSSYGGYGDFGGFGGFEDFFGGAFQGRGYSGSSTGYEEDNYIRAAGNYVRNGYYKEARNVLDGMEEDKRSARWYYYSALAHAGLGNQVSALEHARKASSMEPSNADYRNLVNQFENGGSWYQQKQYTYGQPYSVGNGLCMKLCIANLLCNLCCGGGGLCCGGNPYGRFY